MKRFDLTPELQEAITRVFDDGQQNWDRGEGWPPDEQSVVDQYDLVMQLTKYADSHERAKHECRD